MKTLTLFLLIFSAYSLINDSPAWDTLSKRFQHFHDPETYSMPFNNLSDDQSDYVWQESNEEGVIVSIMEWPPEENGFYSQKDDQNDVDLHNALLQILKDSSYQAEISSFFESFVRPDQQGNPIPLKTTEGYIDLFDLLIFGSLRSRKVYEDTYNEEEFNEEGRFRTVAYNDAELADFEEDDFVDDDDEGDQVFIDFLTSNKNLNGEFIIEIVLNMMDKHTNDADDSDEEEEEILFDQKEVDFAEVKPLPVIVMDPEAKQDVEGDNFLSQTDGKEGIEMNQVFDF